MYNKRKKEKKKKILITCIILLCLIIGFIINVVLTERKSTIFEKAIKDSVLTVQNIFSYPIDFISNKITENKEKNKMYDEYKKLEEKVDKVDELIAENNELEKQIKELQTILNINTILSEYVSINASVTNRNLGYWNETLVINKGETDGIIADMPVIVSNGLIGKVIKTTSFTSTVRLLSANNSNDRISVKIQNGEEYVYGILNGYNKENDTYIIEGISQNIYIESGAIVTTTGMGDIFPAGIVIGKIIGINTDNFDLANVLEMKSDVNFNDINYVTVLKRNDQ